MAIRKRTRRVVVPVAAMTLLVSSGLWVWTSGVYYRPLPAPACVVRLPFVSLEACANDEGVHFVAMKQRARQWPAIQFGCARHGVYPHGYVFNILGLVVSVLPTQYDGGDYFVSPHAALVLPYWLLIVGAGYLLIVLTPVATWIAPYCRLSKFSGSVAGCICVLFALLNLVPSAWRPGATIRPESIREWVTLTLEPHVDYPEIMLVYGFPFACYRKGLIDGQSVNLFYGAERWMGTTQGNGRFLRGRADGCRCRVGHRVASSLRNPAANSAADQVADADREEAGELSLS